MCEEAMSRDLPWYLHRPTSDVLPVRSTTASAERQHIAATATLAYTGRSTPPDHEYKYEYEAPPLPSKDRPELPPSLPAKMKYHENKGESTQKPRHPDEYVTSTRDPSCMLTKVAAGKSIVNAVRSDGKFIGLSTPLSNSDLPSRVRRSVCAQQGRPECR